MFLRYLMNWVSTSRSAMTSATSKCELKRTYNDLGHSPIFLLSLYVACERGWRFCDQESMGSFQEIT